MLDRITPRWFWDRHMDMLSLPGFLVCFVLAVAALVVPVLGIAAYDDNNKCGYAQAQYKRDTHWNLWRGCYINSSGDQYVPLGAYKVYVKGER